MVVTKELIIPDYFESKPYRPFRLHGWGNIRRKVVLVVGSHFDLKSCPNSYLPKR